jgi:ribosomal protein S18 acetylase RimI-like enzyme
MSTVSISIRPATTADGAAVLDLAPRLTEGVAPWRDRAQALAAARSWLTGSLTDAAAGTGIVFVAIAPPAPGVLGVLSIRPARHFTGEHDGYIGELAVAGHAARQGIGRALIDAADSWARDAGLTNLTLHTGAYNSSARAFYAALGFAEEEVRLTRPVSADRTPG